MGEKWLLMKSMLDSGMSVREVAAKIGCSYQNVYTAMNTANPAYVRMAKPSSCIYPNLRKWMYENGYTQKRFMIEACGRYGGNSYKYLQSKLRGDSQLKKSDIDRILALTGMTYEVCFKEDCHG